MTRQMDSPTAPACCRGRAALDRVYSLPGALVGTALQRFCRVSNLCKRKDAPS